MKARPSSPGKSKSKASATRTKSLHAGPASQAIGTNVLDRRIPSNGSVKSSRPFSNSLKLLSRQRTRAPRREQNSFGSPKSDNSAIKNRSKSIRPAIKWHGGKSRLAAKIIECFPNNYEELTYVEPFGGGASVLLKKNPSVAEIYNDLNREIFNFFQVLRERGDELIRQLMLTPYNENEFDSLVELPRADDALENARRFYVRHRQSFGGRGETFSYTVHESVRCVARAVSDWRSSIEQNLPLLIDRLQNVQFLSRPAIDIIRRWDSPETLFYLDPPYVSSTRTSSTTYEVEMSDEEHLELAKVIRTCTGKVILSGYANPLYDELFADWHCITFEVPNNAASGDRKGRREEVLWLNFDS